MHQGFRKVMFFSEHKITFFPPKYKLITIVANDNNNTIFESLLQPVIHSLTMEIFPWAAEQL